MPKGKRMTAKRYEKLVEQAQSDNPIVSLKALTAIYLEAYGPPKEIK